MSAISDKVLQSGIIEKHMLEMLVRWGAFSENALDIIKNDTLRNATLAQLKKFAEELSVELKKEYPFRETMLDSPHRWPTSFTVMGEVVVGDQLITPGPPRSVHNIPAMRDDLLRLFVSANDVDPDWLVPGYRISVKVMSKEFNCLADQISIITRVDPIYVLDKRVSYMVIYEKEVFKEKES